MRDQAIRNHGSESAHASSSSGKALEGRPAAPQAEVIAKTRALVAVATHPSSPTHTSPMHTFSRRPGRLRLLPATAAAALAVLAMLPVGTSHAAAGCSAAQRPAPFLRLLNATRAQHGVPPVRLDARLVRSARRHSCDMVAHHYFAHESRSGARFSARIARVGWMRGRRRWRVGENLAWGTGQRAAPATTVTAWLKSPAHRRILLSPRFRVVGVGIVRGTPIAGASGRTYTTDFGS